MRVEWPTVGLIALSYGVWLLAGFWLWPVVPVLALLIMVVMAALQSSLVHECLHGHPTRHRLVNEALVTLPLSLVYPYRRFKALHLAHHHDARLTDPFDDSESYYQARWKHAAMPGWLKWLLKINNTLIGRMVLGPLLGTYNFIVSDFKLARANADGVRLAWALHLPAVAVVLGLAWAMGIPVWLYVVAVAWPAASLISLRTFAEHQWHETPEGRTIIVERSPLAWIFLHNNLHFVHHQLPSVPWYKLPGIYAAKRAEWQERNQGYVFPNYRALWRQWAVQAKEPVVHPALRCEPDAGASL